MMMGREPAHQRMDWAPGSRAAGLPWLTASIAGPAASANDEVKIFKGIDGTLLSATLAVVIVLLLLTYRSPVLWLLPILSAGVALTVAEAVIYELTRHANLTVNGQSEGILVVLVIEASALSARAHDRANALAA